MAGFPPGAPTDQGFGGAALSAQTAGVVALWAAVVVGWAWLAATSIHLYRAVPHPDPERRASNAA